MTHDKTTTDMGSLSKETQDNEKLRGHLDRLVRIARKHGFQGSSPNDLSTFLDEGLEKAQTDARQLAAVRSALKRLDPLANIQSCARIIGQATAKISAQEATIKVLVSKNTPEQSSASSPLGFRR